MIASLRGKLESLGGDYGIVDVNGVGYLVYMPTSTISKLGIVGEAVYLRTHLVMREDSVALYGFATEEELELFQTLTGVSGLGPRLGLAALSAMSVEQITEAIATGSTDILTAVPGIGNKMAQRIILELKDKVAAGLILAPSAEIAGENAEVMAALTALGYSAAEASRALASLPHSEMPLEEKVRLALQYFNAK